MDEAAPLLEVDDLRVEFSARGRRRSSSTACRSRSARRDALRRRRIRLRQEHDRARAARPGAVAAGPDRRRPHRLPGRGPAARQRRRDARGARQPDLDDLPGADDLAQPGVHVGEQIGEALACTPGSTRAAARARAIEMLQQVGIPAPERRVDEYPHQLSGGMRQRVMIAMALACRPDLLIADEPTTALDVTVQAQIFELLRELQRDKGTAILLITHDMGAVAEMADRVMVMYAGRVVEQGTAAEVLASPGHPYTQGLIECLPELGSSLALDDAGAARGRRSPRSTAWCLRSGSSRAAAPFASAVRTRWRAAPPRCRRCARCSASPRPRRRAWPHARRAGFSPAPSPAHRRRPRERRRRAAARRARPEGPLRAPGRRLARAGRGRARGRRRVVSHRARQDAGDRRRVGLGQDDHRARRDAARADHGRHGSPRRHGPRHARGRGAAARAQAPADHLPGSVLVAQPAPARR